MAHEWPQGFESDFFHPSEFDRPELMDPAFVRELDTVRMRCGFGIIVNDDARTVTEHELLYAREIAKDADAGRPYGSSWPEDSAHVYMTADEAEARGISWGETPVRAVDVKPALPREGDGCKLSLEERELELTTQLLRMRTEGRWKHLGLGLETAHWHVDDTPRLGARRPAYWVAVSR